jgi:exopolysaccharide biosynthesis protein
LGFVFECGKTGEFAVERRRKSKIEQNNKGLNTAENANQTVTLDADIMQINRHKNDAQKGYPKIADKIGNDIDFG